MTIHAPPRVWWRPVSGEERVYLGAATFFAVVTFLLMPIWHFTGPQNAEMRSYRVEAAAYVPKVEAFVQQYRVGSEAGLPVVAPPPGADVYLLARMWQWYPILRLQKGQTYRLHLSSSDIVHGFSIAPINMNFMVTPGYEYVLVITPREAGVYSVVCNEFCGIGHHLMVGKILVD